MRWLRGHWQLALLTVLVFAFWQTPIMLPMKLLVVYLHELSHLLATLLTGGEVIELTLNPMQGGHVLSRGGNSFIILNAGYLGSLLFGLVLLLIALRSRHDHTAMGIMGGLTLMVAIFYVKGSFALAFTVTTAACMLLLARYASHALNDLVLRVIGLSSMIYVPYDITSDTITRSHLNSDARMLAQAYGGTTVLWGLAWLAISLTLIWYSLRRGLGSNSNVRP